MDAVSESRQGVLATLSVNLDVANYTLSTVKAKLAVARNFRIKVQVEQPEPTHCSENHFLLQ